MTLITVVPGTTFVSGSLVTAAMLNLAANPVVSIADGSLTASALDGPSFITVFGDSFRAVNFLPQGAFDYRGFRSAASQTCAAAEIAWPHRDWWVKPTGVAVSALQVADTPNDRSDASLKLTGDAALTELECGTWIPPEVTGLLKNSTVVFSIYVYNSTGASITPELTVRAATTKGVPLLSGAGVDYAGSGAAANGAWTRITFTLTTATVVNWLNGAHLSFKLNTGDTPLAGEHVILSQAALELTAASATWLKPIPVLPQVPAGTMLPFAGPSTKVPAGWLLCNGTTYNNVDYPALYEAIGTAYGTSGAGTFKVPDGRGRTFTGAEVSALSQSRMEVSVAIISSAGDLLTVAHGATTPLRVGMGAFGHALLNGQTIIALTPTTIQLSASVGAGVSGTVRFSKLGAADAETVGAAGDGMSYGRRVVKVALPNCTVTNGSPLIQPTGLNAANRITAIKRLVKGMSISDGSSGFAAGTTIAAFCCWTGAAAQCQLVASTNYTGATGAITLYFELHAPEGDEWAAERLGEEEMTFNDVEWYNGLSDIDFGDTSRLRPGMIISSAGAGFPAGTVFINSITNSERAVMSAAATANSYPNTVQVTGGSIVRATAQTPDTLPAALINWIIKT